MKILTAEESVESRKLDAALTEVFKSRGALNRAYRDTVYITNLHERIDARTQITDALADWDMIEFRLRRQLDQLHGPGCWTSYAPLP